MIKIFITIFLIGFTITGCAGSPASIITANPQQLQRMETLDLINAWNITGSINALMELNRRKVFSHKEVELIRTHQVATGMSKLALYASQGFPNNGRTIMESGKTLKIFFYSKQTIYLVDDIVARIERFH